MIDHILMRTTLILPGSPFLDMADCIRDFKDDHASLEGNCKCSSATSNTSDTFSKFEFRYFLALSVIPEYDLIRGVPRRSAASNEK